MKQENQIGLSMIVIVNGFGKTWKKRFYKILELNYEIFHENVIDIKYLIELLLNMVMLF